MTETEVAVIGGGASGLIASIASALAGADTIILEHMDRVGKKILATGNGKCNYTNEVQGLSCYRGENPAFAVPVFRQFDQKKTVAFFREIGIEPKIKNGYYYPASEQAASVLDVLRMEAAYTGVKEIVSCEIKAIKRQGDFFLIRTGTGDFRAKSIIFATGLFASPKSGSDGSALPYIEHFGHHIIDIVPALVPLQCRQSFFKMLAGIRAEAEVKLFVENAQIASDFGEVQMTAEGISGIPVFQVSRYGIRALKQGKNVTLILNFLPEFSREQLKAFLKIRKENCPYKGKKDFLIGLFPDKLAKVLLSANDLEEAISSYPLKVTGYQSFEQAQVCSGGVDTTQVNAQTLESTRNSGLYFAGELLDIDGKCGGYNLQWAWSSGYVAGVNASKCQSVFEKGE